MTGAENLYTQNVGVQLVAVADTYFSNLPEDRSPPPTALPLSRIVTGIPCRIVPASSESTMHRLPAGVPASSPDRCARTCPLTKNPRGGVALVRFDADTHTTASAASVNSIVQTQKRIPTVRRSTL